MNEYRLRRKDDTRVRPEHAWSVDTCIRNHFSTLKFNAFDLGFSLKTCNEYTIAQNRQKNVYGAIARQYPVIDDVIEYCLGNAIADVKYVVSYTADNMLKMKSRWDLLLSNFKADCLSVSLCSSLDKNLNSYNGIYPSIIEMFLRGSITLETVAIIHLLTGFMDAADKKVSDRILWPAIHLRIVKYSLFFQNINREVFIGALKEIFATK